MSALRCSFRHVLALAFACVGLLPASSLEPRDAVVSLEAEVSRTPPLIVLRWDGASNATGYRVFRKRLADSAWGQPVAAFEATATQFTDTSVVTGEAYEYRVEKLATNHQSNGYIGSGIDLPLRDERGVVILVIERSLLAPLAPEIAQLVRDLTGDGWRVMRRVVGRRDNVRWVRTVIQRAYLAAPASPRALFLLGRIPVPYSGDIAPDGHPDHRGAWPADTYYADVDGLWPDATVRRGSAEFARHHNVPGDRKLDPSHLPSDVELMTGRVDAADLPQFGLSETDLLRRYLDRNHAFRHGQIAVEPRGLIDDRFGWHDDGAAYAASAWRSFAPLVGRRQVASGNLDRARAASYLWAYGCTSGRYVQLDGMITSEELVKTPLQAVGALLFGSYMGDWDSGPAKPSLLRSAIMADGRTLVAGWSGQPHWFLHHLGLGLPIGYSVRATQNNSGELYRGPGGTGWGSPERGVHIALMGDPTLRLTPVSPASAMTAVRQGKAVRLRWNASTAGGLVGYHVYRAASPIGRYLRLTTVPVSATQFTDLAPLPVALYQVRAAALQRSPSGTYHDQSQGTFARPGL